MKQSEIAKILFIIECYDEIETLEKGIEWWDRIYKGKDNERSVVAEYENQAKNFGWHVVEAFMNALDEKHDRCICGHLEPDHFLPGKDKNAMNSCVSCQKCNQFTREEKVNENTA